MAHGELAFDARLLPFDVELHVAMTIRAFVNKRDGERGRVAGWQGLAQMFLRGVHAAEAVFIRVETEFPDQQSAPGIQLHAVCAGVALDFLLPLSCHEFHCFLAHFSPAAA